MEVKQKLIPVGHPNRPGTKLEALKAIIIHYTANEDPSATDTANIAYIGRGWESGKYWDSAKKVAVTGPIEARSTGKGDKGLGIAFRYGSAHIFADYDSVSQAIPIDEVAWACGDRPLAWTELDRGQQAAARLIFGRRQNYQSVSVEICNNDVLPGDSDWMGAVKNAQDWIIDFLRGKGRRVDVNASIDPQHYKGTTDDGILLLRHFDVSGKICPLPMVKDASAWQGFIEKVASGI